MILVMLDNDIARHQNLRMTLVFGVPTLVGFCFSRSAKPD